MRTTLRPLLLASCLALLSPIASADPPSIDSAVPGDDTSPKDAALIIGNDAYLAMPQVVWADEDARAFGTWARETRGVSKYRTTSIQNARRADMLKHLKKLGWRVRKHGTIWIYFSGHGVTLPNGERALLAADATPDMLAERSVTLDEIVKQATRSKRADKIVIILDAGFGNLGRDGLDLIPGREQKVPDGWGIDDPRVVVWAAARDGSAAQPYEPSKHGLFTWTAVGALRGWADGELDGQRDGKVTLAEAEAYTARVPTHLGRIANPSREDRPAQQAWVLTRSEGLEEGPSDATVDILAAEDLARRVAAERSRLEADAAAFWQDTLEIAQGGGPAGRDALRAYVDEFSRVTLTMTWAVPVDEVREARQLLATYDESGVPAPAAAADTGGDTGAPERNTCDDLLALEGTAMMGQLTGGERACLDVRVGTERLQTGKDKISRLLLVNAEASGDTADWERLMARHLEDIDRSDPDLCFRYAIYLHKNDIEDAEEAIRWADYSLENKHIWEPDAYVKKVYGLYRLRAEAAHRLWRDAEKRYRVEASSENDSQTREYRGWAMDYSREWLDYARAAGKSTKTAENLCMSAAGTADFCKGERR